MYIKFVIYKNKIVSTVLFFTNKEISSIESNNTFLRKIKFFLIYLVIIFIPTDPKILSVTSLSSGFSI